MKSGYLFSFSLLALFLVGCGGSSTPQGNSSGIDSISKEANLPKKEVKTIIGHVIDSPIWGLEYRCKGQTSKTTDQFGTFECESLPVTFKVGDLVVGHISTMPQDAKIYPQDIIGVSRDKVDDSDVMELTRFFQTLDDDGRIDEVIKIEASLLEKFVFKNKIDLTTLDEGALLDIAVDKIGRPLVAKEAAEKHLRKNLVDGKKPAAIELSLLMPATPKGLESKAIVNGIYTIADGQVKCILTKEVIFTSSDTSIATIDNNGKIKALTEGTVEISAKYGDLTTTAHLRVTHTTLTKIEISTPTMAELTRLALGGEAFFRVKGFYSADGIEKDVTSQVIWSSKSPLLSDIDATNPNNNNNYYPYRLKANGVGKASLLATLFDLTDKVEFDIQASEITRVGINIKDVKIPLGSTMSRYNLLLGYYADDSNRTLGYNFGEKDPAISWTVDNENILEYSNFSSQYIAKEKGEVTLTAKYKTFEDSIKLTIVDPAIKTLVIDSDNNLYIGDSTKVRVIGNYTDGKEENITSKVLFKSLNPAIFSITPDGNLTAIKEGYGHFEVTYVGADKNITSTKYITVQKPYVAPVPVEISIQPEGSDEIHLGSGKRLYLRVAYDNGQVSDASYIGGQNISIGHSASDTYTDTNGVTWTIDDKSIASFNTSRGSYLQGLKIGEVTVRATVGDLTTSKTLQVVGPTSVAIFMEGSNTLSLGQTKSLSLHAIYSDGSKEAISSDDIYWEVDNRTVAKLNMSYNTLLSGMQKGEVTVTAKYLGHTTTSVINVVGPTSIIISSGNTQEMPIGSSKNLTLQALYADGTTQSIYSDISWEVDNSDIANMTGDYLRASKKGEVTVKATYHDLTTTKTFKVIDPLFEGIEITPLYASNVFIGETKQFNVVEKYSDNSQKDVNGSVVWKVMSNIATVSEDGKVTGIYEGTTKLKATYKDNSTFTNITIIKVALSYLRAINSYNNIDINTTVQLQVEGHYNSGMEKDLTKDLTWASDNETIATVDNSGKVTAIASGGTYIRVTHNSGKSTTFYINVQ